MEADFAIVPYVEETQDESIQLSPIVINADYRKKWNVSSSDFVCLTKNGKLINNSLFRVGGLGGKPGKKRYFMLLKYVESYYEDSIIKDKNKKPHLAGKWCILDNNGIIKVEFDQFKSPYITDDSIVYSIDHNYYNIETGEFYCHAYDNVRSDDFIFLANNYDKDPSRRGVMKIDKVTGTWELFPIKK